MLQNKPYQNKIYLFFKIIDRAVRKCSLNKLIISYFKISFLELICMLTFVSKFSIAYYKITAEWQFFIPDKTTSVSRLSLMR